MLGPGGDPGDDDVLHHDRRAALAGEETFKTGKDVLGWDQSQARTWDGICRHTALAALAQLRDIAIRNGLCGDITPAPAPAADGGHDGKADDDENKDDEDEKKISDADLRIPLGDAAVPALPGQPCPPGIGAVKLTIAETARLVRLARQYAAGLITGARLAFHLRWSRWRRRRHPRPLPPLLCPARRRSRHLTLGRPEGGDAM